MPRLAVIQADTFVYASSTFSDHLSEMVSLRLLNFQFIRFKGSLHNPIFLQKRIHVFVNSILSRLNRNVVRFTIAIHTNLTYCTIHALLFVRKLF